jgi:hypothetical protein
MPDDEPAVVGEVKAEDSRNASGPELSAILFVPGGYEAVRRTMDHLRAQTAVGRIEMVIVTTARDRLELDEPGLSRFHSWQVVEAENLRSASAAYAAGIRSAKAPVVALTEDHAFPDSNWAEVLIEAHRQPWAAVGPSVRNGNPETLLSCADFCHAYSYWAAPVSSGLALHLPGHNGSYKRDLVLAFDSDLDFLMEAESILHRRLRAQGHKLLLDSATCTSHCNFTSWSAWVPLRYHIGRQFAAVWARGWPWHRRLLFTAASPFIPWLRLWRIGRNARRTMPCGLLIRVLPIVFLGLLIEWAGQAIGFSAGPGDSTEKADRCEARRFG